MFKPYIRYVGTEKGVQYLSWRLELVSHIRNVLLALHSILFYSKYKKVWSVECVYVSQLQCVGWL